MSLNPLFLTFGHKFKNNFLDTLQMYSSIFIDWKPRSSENIYYLTTETFNLKKYICNNNSLCIQGEVPLYKIHENNLKVSVKSKKELNKHNLQYH